MLEWLSDNRAHFAAAIIIALIALLLWSIYTGRKEARRTAKDEVFGIQQSLRHQVEQLIAARSDDDLVGGHKSVGGARAISDARPIQESRPQLRQAGGRTVLQGGFGGADFR